MMAAFDQRPADSPRRALVGCNASFGSARDNDRASHQCSVIESTLPSGSLNHATRAPLGDVQMPSSSCPIPSKCTNATPRAPNAIAAPATLGTCQPKIVKGAG